MIKEREQIEVGITALGTVCSLGLNAVQSCAAIRAGIAGFRQWDGYHCQQVTFDPGNLEPLVCARIPMDGPPRDDITNFAVMVLKEVIETARLSRALLTGRTGLYLSLPPDRRADKETGLSGRILEEIQQRTGIPGFQETSLITSGHAGAMLAMQEAAARLKTGEVDYGLVVGADSYFDLDVLAWLDDAGRLKSEQNKDGFIPGQGAAAVLLERGNHAADRSAPVLAWMDGFGQAREEHLIFAEQPSVGQGLCQAIQACCPGGQEEQPPLTWVLCDLNGESYRSREWGYSLVKLHDSLNAVQTLWHPADCVGDMGAASGALLAVLAARAFQRGYAPDHRTLVWSGSDNGDRCAMLLRSPG